MLDCLESLYGINIWLAGMLCMSIDQSHHQKDNIQIDIAEI